MTAEDGRNPAPRSDRRGPGSTVGILMACGLVAGALVGGVAYYSPAPGALIGGGLGIVLGLLIDRWRKS